MIVVRSSSRHRDHASMRRLAHHMLQLDRRVVDPKFCPSFSLISRRIVSLSEVAMSAIFTCAESA